jgi:hypothetical protein
MPAISSNDRPDRRASAWALCALLLTGWSCGDAVAAGSYDGDYVGMRTLNPGSHPGCVGTDPVKVRWKIINNHYHSGYGGNQTVEQLQCNADLDANGAFQCTISYAYPGGGRVTATRTGRVAGETLLGTLDSNSCHYSFNLQKVHP